MSKNLMLMTDLEIIEMIKYNQSIGKGDTETGREYGVTREKIRGYRRKFNIDLSILEEFKLKEEKKLIDIIKEKAKIFNKPKDISKEIDVSLSRIKKLIEKYNISLTNKIKCLNCNKEFEPTKTGRRNLYCSNKCREDYKTKNKKSICKTCGKEFVGNKTYCSDECKRSVTLQCKICGKQFNGFCTEKFCSKECKEENEKRRYIEYSSKEIQVECEVCGAPMIMKATSKKQRICSLKRRSKFLDYRVNQSLEKIFETNDEQKIKELVRRKINEKAC